MLAHPHALWVASPSTSWMTTLLNIGIMDSTTRSIPSMAARDETMYRPATNSRSNMRGKRAKKLLYASTAAFSNPLSLRKELKACRIRNPTYSTDWRFFIT